MKRLLLAVCLSAVLPCSYAYAAPNMSQVCTGAGDSPVCGTGLGHGMYMETANYNLHWLVNGISWMEWVQSGTTLTLVSEQATTLVYTDDAVFSGTLTSTGLLEGSNLHTDTVTISTAELVALRATPKTLVAAQGAGTFVELVSIVWHLNYGSAQCTESADNLDVLYVDASGLAITTTVETTGSWLVAAADATGWTIPLATLLTGSGAQVENVPIILDNSGDGEFGDCTGSSVTALVTYRVHTVN